MNSYINDKKYLNINKTFFNNNELKQDIIECINFFKNLDNEFNNKNKNKTIKLAWTKENEKLKNKHWEGFWLHASGFDLDLFLNWLEAGLKYEKYKTNTLEYWFKINHPSSNFVPYSITIANKMLKKVC